MLKLMTAYSMYFNTRCERSRPLFSRPFRSKHVDSDEYFRWLFSYILLNPLDLHQTNWKRDGLSDAPGARQFMRKYRYSSFTELLGDERMESRIINREASPVSAQEMSTVDALLQELSARNGAFDAQSAL